MVVVLLKRVFAYTRDSCFRVYAQWNSRNVCRSVGETSSTLCGRFSLGSPPLFCSVRKEIVSLNCYIYSRQFQPRCYFGSLTQRALYSPQ
jgi:hypothetical protein